MKITLEDLRRGCLAECESFDKLKKEATEAAVGNPKEADRLLTERILSDFIQFNLKKNQESPRLALDYDTEKHTSVSPCRKEKTLKLKIKLPKKPESLAINSINSVAQESVGSGFWPDLVASDNKKRKRLNSTTNRSAKNAEINHSAVQPIEGKPKQSKGHQRTNSKVTQQMGPDPPPDLPKEFRDRIMGMQGYDIKLVIQKELSDTDLRATCDRLSIPNKQSRAEFLTEEEKADMEKRKRNGIHLEGMQVPLMEPNLEESNILVKRWKLGSQITNILSSPWNEVAKRNSLKSKDIVQLWSFRANQRLWLAFVKLGS
ncbi:hypothetical protein CJ030_MR1G013798 [Morella rubra]|uniref:B3 domain-containing protein n=1 Tax=Morella rubra TaxID=262757 RepID=A0A6A1WW22_9ROSI|nr:hypothetical protein CJ030_MR1G013798 [Morella rubra]